MTNQSEQLAEAVRSRGFIRGAETQLSKVVDLLSVEPPVVNIDGRAGRISGDNLHLSGQRWETSPSERPEASNPLWVQTGDTIEVSRFTARYGSDQNLTLGPVNDDYDAGRRLKRVHLHDGIVSHGIMYDGHPDDPDNSGHGHSHGCLVRAGALQVTIERLVMAHNASRALCHLGTHRGRIVGEIVNSICYNPMQQIFDLMGDDPDSRWNIRNCIIKAGPDTRLNSDGTMQGISPRPFRIGTSGVVHMSGCLLELQDGTRVDAQQALLTDAEREAMPPEPHSVGSVADDPLPAADLYDILDGCGADGEYEQTIREQVRRGTGSILRKRAA